ncbi:thiamine pyrophosphokinase 1-like protein [Apostichopus japonicus]|uniref:Thiamine pyrophosphokinase 1-like protein n=1 Tax=Stichopus japonicus TaxID=307972 RepID=A0A2G8JCF0_STIJA|nr:thiamine pyrophosphokinase 1-like protein [Apostichopus japonicus]
MYPKTPLDAIQSPAQKHLDVLWEQSSLQAVTDGANNSLYELMKQKTPHASTHFLSTSGEPPHSWLRMVPSIHKLFDCGCFQCDCCPFVPDLVTGDFDSIRKEVKSFMEEKGSKIIHTPDQDKTDFRKCLEIVADQVKNEKGHHTIDISSGLEGSTCGLFPLGGKCEAITTTGLKWNLNQDQMEFGGLISSCNTYEKDATEVTVENNSPILWTMDIAK